MNISNLPDDVLLLITEEMVGHDIYSLALTCKRLFTILTSHQSIWTRRLPFEKRQGNVMKKYLEESTFKFDASHHARGSSFNIPNDTVLSITRRPHNLPSRRMLGSLSADVWFCMINPHNIVKWKWNGNGNGNTDAHRGGVILGAQSGSILSDSWPHYHLQFILVTVDGQLSASFGWKNRLIDVKLENEKWYHVALCLDMENMIETVYLNGKLVQEVKGYEIEKELNQMPFLTNMQFGSGVISGDSLGKPTINHCGWYPFNGYIYEGRLWKKCLSSAEVKSMYLEQNYSEITGNSRLFSMKQSQQQQTAIPTQCRVVKTSLPLERVLSINNKSNRK